MPVDLAAPPSRWTDGLADGHVDRQPSPAEWPFLGWSRLRVGGTDIGLITSDFYSHSVDGALWQPTLLRSPRMAWGGGDPRTYAGHDQHTDQGVHRFALTLRFGERLSEADLAAALADAAQPLVVFDRYEGMDRPAWGPVPPRGLWGPAMLRNVADGRVTDPGQDAPGGLFNRPGQTTTPAKGAIMTLTDQQRIERLRRRLEELELWTVRAGVAARRLDLQRRPPRPRRRLADPRRRRRPRPRRRRGPGRLAARGGPARRRPRRRGPAAHRLRRRRRRRLRPRPQPPALPAQGPPLLGRAPSASPACPSACRTATPASPAPAWSGSTPSSPSSPSCSLRSRETAEVLAGHEVVPPLLAAAEDALAELDWPTATLPYVARVAPGWQMQRVWQLPADLATDPPGLEPRARRRRRHRLPARAPARPARPLPADRRAGADRPRPHRPRLALAARRDPAQGQPHLLRR